MDKCTLSSEQWLYSINSIGGRGSRDGAVMRALAADQCVPDSIPGPVVVCGLSLFLILFSAPRHNSGHCLLNNTVFRKYTFITSKTNSTGFRVVLSFSCADLQTFFTWRNSDYAAVPKQRTFHLWEMNLFLCKYSYSLGTATWPWRRFIA